MPVSNPWNRSRLTWIPPFLEAISRGQNTCEACRCAGITSQSAYHRRRIDREFRREWAEAAHIGTQLLEHEAERRAYHGTGKPVFYRGEQCGEVQEYSDSLLMFLLKARKPATYRERDPAAPTVNVAIQANIAAVDTLNKLLEGGEKEPIPPVNNLPAERVIEDDHLDG